MGSAAVKLEQEVSTENGECATSAEGRAGFCSATPEAVVKFDKSVFEGVWLDSADFKGAKGSEALAIKGMDYAQIFSANAFQTAFYFSRAFGFQPVAYRGPETGFRGEADYVLQQGDIRFVISGAMNSGHPISEQVYRHGMTVTDLAMEVVDCEAFYYEALRRGALSAAEPRIYTDAFGSVKRAAIKTYGNVIHSIVERIDYKGAFWPGYVAYDRVFPGEAKVEPVGLVALDHVVGNVELGRMEEWVSFYEKVLDFKEMAHFSDDDISTEYSALMSKVVANGSGKVKFPINEPATGKRKSQIDEYLDFHESAGVQHMALRTDDILKTVAALRKNGVRFLRVPHEYYEEAPQRVGSIKEDMNDVAALGILVDRDDDGYLLQLFTKPTQDRPTLFIEIIQREGSEGFGKGNFKALFEAIELEQERRGNL
jgi:4-hydroxyphenylpyruvate dioxygenase